MIQKSLLVCVLLLALNCRKQPADRINISPITLPDSLTSGLLLLSPGAEPFLSSMDSLAGCLRPLLFNATPESALAMIAKAIYQDYGMQFNPEPDKLENVLPQIAWKNRGGGCLGVGMAVLILGEKLGLPLHGVLLPGHLFVRWDDGKTRINFEPNLHGVNHPDGYYVERYGILNHSFYTLSNLTARQALAVLSYGIGSCYLKQNECKTATGFFLTSTHNFPEFAEAFGNLAIAYCALGDSIRAIQAYRDAEKSRPDLPNLSYYLGMLYQERGQADSARLEFKKGLSFFPQDTLLQSALKFLQGR